MTCNVGKGLCTCQIPAGPGTIQFWNAMSEITNPVQNSTFMFSEAVSLKYTGQYNVEHWATLVGNNNLLLFRFGTGFGESFLMFKEVIF